MIVEEIIYKLPVPKGGWLLSESLRRTGCGTNGPIPPKTGKQQRSLIKAKEKRKMKRMRALKERRREKKKRMKRSKSDVVHLPPLL